MDKINVLNIHITDYCNFKCLHCFVCKEKKSIDFNDFKKCVDKFIEYCNEYKIKNPRINLAGGEPLMYPKITEAINYIYSKGIKVSLITNGFHLTDEFLKENKDKIYMIGISIDSLNKNTNNKLGRKTNNFTCDEKFYRKKCNMIKRYNIKLKINICINKLNMKENFTDLLNNIKPDKVKILNTKYEDGINEKFKDYILTNEQYREYVNMFKNNICSSIKCVFEENMENSYLILDSKCQLSTNNNHKIENSLLKNSFEYCYKNLDMNIDLFNKKYE